MNDGRITPVVLTLDEAPNIERTLAPLAWARRVLVVDSQSTDGTQELARRFSNVRVVERPFDSHAAQWEFGIRHPEIKTDWILALDADWVLTPELAAEIRALDLDASPRGYRIRFRYCIGGRPLRASVYPPAIALFDRRLASFVQEGHTQRTRVAGAVAELSGACLHDDRKPIGRFLANQRRYAELEAGRLLASKWSELPWSGRIRKLRWVAPWLVPVYLLLGKGLILDGRSGRGYARERWLAECAIARALGASGEVAKPRRISAL